MKNDADDALVEGRKILTELWSRDAASTESLEITVDGASGSSWLSAPSAFGAHIDRDGTPYSTVRREEAVEALNRVLEHRWSDEGMMSAQAPAATWIAAVRAENPAWLSCEISVESGWQSLVLAMIEHVAEIAAKGELFEGFTQIKEKMGGLRVYSRGSSMIARIIDAYEFISLAICENCGAPGRLRKFIGRHFVRCDECDEAKRTQRV